ncbi:hypothetical protein GQX74_013273 [Glossina fuscipes]|nr:hypothetical protein GQX74_013273 [Glossina fuscipes]
MCNPNYKVQSSGVIENFTEDIPIVLEELESNYEMTEHQIMHRMNFEFENLEYEERSDVSRSTLTTINEQIEFNDDNGDFLILYTDENDELFNSLNGLLNVFSHHNHCNVHQRPVELNQIQSFHNSSHLMTESGAVDPAFPQLSNSNSKALNGLKAIESSRHCNNNANNNRIHKGLKRLKTFLRKTLFDLKNIRIFKRRHIKISKSLNGNLVVSTS